MRSRIRSKSVAMITSILTAQLLIMVVVYIFVNRSVTAEIQENAIQSMEIISRERTQIIENYILETENYLTAYSRAGEICRLLEDPQNPDNVALAQAYTELFSKDREHLEGIYTSEWNSHVLVHTNPAVVGITTREGDSLKALQTAMQEAEGVYNTGIIISPASQKQIISLYRACYDENNEPNGLVGCGIYTDGLVNQLDSLPNTGMEQMKYYLINAQTGEYIFHENAEQIATIAEDEFVHSILTELKQNSGRNYGSVSFSENGERFIASYNYMASRGWVFIVTDPEAEVFASLAGIRLILALICIVGIVLLTVFTYLIINRLIRFLREAVGALGMCCDSLSQKADELNSHSDHLSGCVTDNASTINELSISLVNTDHLVENVNERAAGIDQWMSDTLIQLQSSVDASETLIVSSRQMVAQAQDAYEGSAKTFEETKEIVRGAVQRLQEISRINQMTDNIMNIASETQLLSVNASLEAGRAGAAGKGFAVVAGEIRNLVETTTSTAEEIQNICVYANQSIRDVEQCFDTILQFLEKTVMEQFRAFAEKAAQYGTAVNEIRDDISNLNNSTDVLNNALKQITDSVSAVKEITQANGSAIGTIDEKNRDTSRIANKIQLQSDDNQTLISQLEEIIRHFQTYTS